MAPAHPHATWVAVYPALLDKRAKQCSTVVKNEAVYLFLQKVKNDVVELLLNQIVLALYLYQKAK